MRLIIVSTAAREAGARSRARSTARRWSRAAGARALPAPELVTPTRFKALLPDLDRADLVYVDLSAFPASQALVRLRRLLRSAEPMIGVADPGGQVRDIPALFHAGAVDYLDRAAWRRGLTAARLATVLAWARGRQRTEGAPSTAPSSPADGPCPADGRLAADWSAIRPGEEHTFSLGFVELDGGDELGRRYGAADLAEALASFRAWVERSVAPANGRIWTWNRFGGIVLFPFDGEHERAAPCLLRLVLFRQLFDVEESRFPNFISCRLAVHLGDLAWREQQTGTLVSDALNTTFHLGRRFVPEGRCCVTDEVYRLAPPALQELFLPAGEFEGRRIWLLRKLRTP